MNNDRREFALLMRALALYGLDDLNFTHCSMREPGGRIMITSRHGAPFWACDERDIAFAPPQPRDGIEPNAQWPFNARIHDRIERAHVVIHTHSAAAIAMAAFGGGGLPPISQNSLLFDGDFLGVVPYEVLVGVATDEADNCVRKFGATRMALLLAGHGTLTLGRSIGEAFEIAYNLERACRIHLATMRTGAPIITDAQRRRGKADWLKDGRMFGRNSWPSVRDALERFGPTPIQRSCA